MRREEVTNLLENEILVSEQNYKKLEKKIINVAPTAGMVVKIPNYPLDPKIDATNEIKIK